MAEIICPSLETNNNPGTGENPGYKVKTLLASFLQLGFGLNMLGMIA
jgi:hypothetical protein